LSELRPEWLADSFLRLGARRSSPLAWICRPAPHPIDRTWHGLGQSRRTEGRNLSGGQEIIKPEKEQVRAFWSSMQELFTVLYGTRLATIAAINVLPVLAAPQPKPAPSAGYRWRESSSHCSNVSVQCDSMIASSECCAGVGTGSRPAAGNLLRPSDHGTWVQAHHRACSLRLSLRRNCAACMEDAVW
jgi:hypothetical protein